MQENTKVLVVEDDPIVRQFLDAAIRGVECATTCVGDGREAIKELDKNEFDIVFTDLRIPEVTGIEVLKHTKKSFPQTDVIIGTAFGSIENAVEAMRIGAYDYLTKPFAKKDIQQVIKRVIKKRQMTGTQNANGKADLSKIMVGESEPIQKILELVERIAPTNASVLIEGETGVGKEVVADVIHKASPFKDRPYVKVNCAALPDTLMESELFGHEKGAFTGAHMRRKGRFEEANGGTILLDEIGELALPMQAKLLRVLQNKEFQRLGDNKTIRVDARVIATTNKDLKEEVKAGTFRKDLYFRLNVIKIVVPPLRDRGNDMALLADFFLNKVNIDNGMRRKFNKSALEKLCSYDWPGNVRELQNTVEKVAVIAANDMINADDFELIDEYSDLFDSIFETETDMTIYEAEKKLILSTLKRCANNKTKAADALGITVKTLRNKLKLYGEDSGEETTQ